MSCIFEDLIYFKITLFIEKATCPMYIFKSVLSQVEVANELNIQILTEANYDLAVRLIDILHSTSRIFKLNKNI